MKNVPLSGDSRNMGFGTMALFLRNVLLSQLLVAKTSELATVGNE